MRYQALVAKLLDVYVTIDNKDTNLADIYGSERNSIDDFIANANRFIDIRELTPEIVHAFVSKIYVYEKKEKWSRTEGNDIDIVFTVGFKEQHPVRTSDAIAS